MAPFDPHDTNADPSIPVNTPTPIQGQVVIVDYDPAWPGLYAREEDRIRAALGERALQVAHMGSTSVPGLLAKPCIDILLAVADAGDETAYLPDLVAAGYVLRIRESAPHPHRAFKGAATNLNLHVWSAGCPEIARHLAFRDWLRAHPDDRDRYAATKRSLARRYWETMDDYADAKDAIVAAIHARIEAAR